MQRAVQLLKQYACASAAGDRQTAAKDLRRFLLESNDLTALLTEDDADIEDYVRASLLGTRPALLESESKEDSERSASLRLDIYKHVINFMSNQDSPLTDTQAEKLIGSLTGELEYINSPIVISNIIDSAASAFSSDSSVSWAPLGLLPKAFSVLEAMGGNVDVQGEAGATATCQASDYCRGVMRSICQHSWPAKTLSRILVALREFTMPEALLKDAVVRGATTARAADIQDLPVIIHQLLVLGGHSCKDIVLAEIVKLFDRLESDAGKDESGQRMRQLLQVEGSVLLHVDMAVKHNMELGQAWVKRLKAPTAATSLTPFALSLSFAIAGVQRFEDPVLEALKRLITAWYKDNGMLSTVRWLPRPTTSSASKKTDPLEQALLTCVRNSVHWQGAIVQPAVTLAVSLMESSATKAVGESRIAAKASPSAKMARLGTSVLLEIFSAHPPFRRDLINTATVRLVGRSEEAAAPFLRFLALMVSKDTATLEAHANDLRVPLENLTVLPTGVALSLLLAVWPMCRRRRDLRDHVVMLLRKAMFGRELGARLLAARGFLFLLAEELSSQPSEQQNTTNGGGAGSSNGGAGGSKDAAGPSFSQAPIAMSQREALKGGPGGGTLLHELMGFMRRCLAHQPAVRVVVYQGLPTLLQADPAAQESVAELLLPHLSQYYESLESMICPLKLDMCARAGVDGEAARLFEPLNRLIACVHAVTSLKPALEDSEAADTQANGGGRRGPVRLGSMPTATGVSPSATQQLSAAATGGPSTTALRKMLEFLRSRMAACPLEDYGFDQSTTFSAADCKGEYNSLLADVLLGCYEALMESSVDVALAAAEENDYEAADTAGEELKDLFHHHRRLTELVTDGSKQSRSKNVADGLTQALGAGASRKRTAPTATSAANTTHQSIDKRLPMLSVPCLVNLLKAVVEDGLIKRGGGAVHSQLARDTDFRAFVLNACVRSLDAGMKQQLDVSISTGTVDDEESTTFARHLFGLPDWSQLSGQLFITANTSLIAYMQNRSAPVAGAKKEKDVTLAVTIAAAKSLESLLAAGWASGEVAGVAKLVISFPGATNDELSAGGLPAVTSASDHQKVIANRATKFKRLLDDAVKHCCGKELDPLCRCLAILANCLPTSQAEALGSWAEAAGKSAPTALAQQATAAAAIATQALRCKEMGGSGADAALLQWMATEITAAINDGDGEGGGTLSFTARPQLPLLAHTSLNTIVKTILEHLESSLGALEWALSKLERHSVEADSDSDGGNSSSTSTREFSVISSRTDWEQATYGRLKHLVETITVLSKARLHGKSIELLVHASTRLYKILAAAVKSQTAPKGITQGLPGRTFREMVDYTNSTCTPTTYEMIAEVQRLGTGQENNENNEDDDEEAEKKRKKKARTTAEAAAKSDKTLPELIFQMEAYERNLILLSKKIKVNLMATAKRSTARAFKVNASEIAEHLNNN